MVVVKAKSAQSLDHLFLIGKTRVNATLGWVELVAKAPGPTGASLEVGGPCGRGHRAGSIASTSGINKNLGIQNPYETIIVYWDYRHQWFSHFLILLSKWTIEISDFPIQHGKYIPHYSHPIIFFNGWNKIGYSPWKSRMRLHSGKWTIEISDFPFLKPPFSSGIFQPAMFDDQRVYLDIEYTNWIYPWIALKYIMIYQGIHLWTSHPSSFLGGLSLHWFPRRVVKSSASATRPRRWGTSVREQ